MKRIEDNNAFLMAMGQGSRIEIHAAGAAKESWTQIGDTAAVGDITLKLSESTGWQAGDKIVIASTGFDMDEAEYRTITHVSEDGLSITLDKPLENDHFGQIKTYSDGLDGEDSQSWELDMRAEVALLSRNVTIQGDADSAKDYYGGHTMVMNGASMHIDGAELTKMGQIGEVGRYPLHWHMLGDGSGQYITNSSIHETYNKGMTIHGTQNTWVEDNVIVNTIGHGFYFEDGSETGNVLKDNLGMNTVKAVSIEAAPIASDNTEVSTYWVTNPDNHVIGNHAAGSDDTGFWVLSQDKAEGKSAQDDRFSSMVPREAAPGTWSGNVAHSNADDGFWIGSQFNEENGNKTEPKLEVPFLLEDFTTFKNEGWGIWMRNANGDFEDLKIADSNAGIQMWGHSNLSNSLFVGRSENADDTLGQHVGWQPYDDSVGVTDVHFTGFTGDGDTAISNGWGFGRAVNHSVEGLTFGDDVENRFLNTLVNEKFGGFTQIDGKNVSDQGGPIAGGIIDVDGSLTGIAGSTLTPALIDFIPNRHVDVAVDAIAKNEASGFNTSKDAIWLEKAQAWIHQPDTVIGKMDIVQKKLVLTDDENKNDYNITDENGTIISRRSVENVSENERLEYTITRSDNGASLAIGSDAMVSYAWHTQLNVDTSDGVEYIIEYTNALPEALTIELTQMLEGSTAYYRFKALPENVTIQGADAAASIEEFNAATATTWFKEENGDYVVKAFADSFLPWKGLPRNDSEPSQERIFTDEFKLFIKDAETIEAKPNGIYSPEPGSWMEASPIPVPVRAESTSETVEITDADNRWSDANSWDNGVPGVDDIVIIGDGQRMVLNQDVTVKAILVNGGELIVEDTKDLAVASDWVLVVNGGLFQVGSEENPHQHEFELTLEGDDAENDVDVMMLMMSENENVVRAVTPTEPVDPIEEPNQVTITDTANNKPWAEITDTFDENGVLAYRETLFDDGRVRETEYSSGEAVRVITTDADDHFNWSTVTKTYQLGELVQHATVKDDGTISSQTFAFGGGPKIQANKFDAGDNFSWDSQVTKYNTDGKVTQTNVIFDDGRMITTEFVGGVKSTQKQVDTSSAKPWSEINKTFDENGKQASINTVNDNGIVTDKTFVDGQIVTSVMFDTAGAKSWSSNKTSFEDGNKTYSEAKYDDGRVATSEFKDGVRKSLTIVDTADNFVWHSKSWEYGSDGEVVTKSVILDIDDVAGGSVGFIAEDSASVSVPTFFVPDTFDDFIFG